MPRLTAEEVQRTLCMLMMVNGFKTDPSQPGVEKMVIAEVNEKWLTEQNRMRISSSDLGLAGNDMLSPQTVFTVKGWNRAICALAVMRATFELREMLQACCIFTNQCIKVQFYETGIVFLNRFHSNILPLHRTYPTQ